MECCPELEINLYKLFLLFFSLKNRYIPPIMIKIEPDKLKRSGNSLKNK